MLWADVWLDVIGWTELAAAAAPRALIVDGCPAASLLITPSLLHVLYTYKTIYTYTGGLTTHALTADGLKWDGMGRYGTPALLCCAILITCSILHEYTIPAYTWTGASKTTDRLPLSSMSELMSVQSDSGRADPRALITWPAPEVAQRLCLLLADDCTFMLKNSDSLVLELSDCFITPGSPCRAVLSITAQSGWVHTTFFHVHVPSIYIQVCSIRRPVLISLSLSVEPVGE